MIPIEIIFTHRCRDCGVMIAPLDINNIRRYEDQGFIFDEFELHNIDINSNIIKCRRCRKALGIKRIDNGNIILFRNCLTADAFIKTQF